MKTLLKFLFSLTFLFLFSGSVCGDDFQDGVDAYTRHDYKEAARLFRLAAEQGNAKSFRSTFIMFGLLRGLKDRDIADNCGSSSDIIHKYYAKYINMIGESFTDLPDG